MKALDRQLLGRGLLLLGIMATVFAYLPGLNGAFFFDDAPNISRNPSVQLTELSWDSLSLAWAGGTSGQFGRPVSQVTFALNHYISGFNPKAFKLTNLVIHCVNGVLMYLLVLQLLHSVGFMHRPGNAEVGAALMASAWLLNPIQLTSVLYAVQRMTSLSAFFVLVALLLHVNARRGRFCWQYKFILFAFAWGVCWLLGILSKESAILFPGFVAVYELIIHRYEQKRLDALGKICFVLGLIFLVASLLYLASPLSQSFLSGYEIRSFSLTERIFSEPRVIWAYISWIVFPSLESLALFHDDFVISTSLLKPWTTLPAIAGLIGLVLIAAFNYRRRPLIAFGIAWFLVGHSLESTVIPLELVHEHRNYLPLLGILFLPVGWVGYLSIESGNSRTLALGLVGGFIAYSGFITSIRADMYSNELRRTQIESQAHPDSARANYEAGRSLAALADHGDNVMATVLSKKHFQMATEADPDYKMGLLGQIILACGVTQRPDQEAIDELGSRFRERLILQEDTSILIGIVEMSGAGLLCLERAQIDGLFEAFFANSKVAPAMKMTMYSLHADYLWLSQNDLGASRQALHRALDLAPENPSLRLKWAQLDYLSGDRSGAKRLLLELQHAPLSSGERNTLKNLLDVLVDGGY